MSILGDNIKNKRLQLNLTQGELATKLGYKSRSSINKIELGINDISQRKIKAFAEPKSTIWQNVLLPCWYWYNSQTIRFDYFLFTKIIFYVNILMVRFRASCIYMLMWLIGFVYHASIS